MTLCQDFFGDRGIYGRGFYYVWKKEDLDGATEGENNKYGKYSYKGTIPLNSKILILDPNFYKHIYKKEPEEDFIKNQLSNKFFDLNSFNIKSEIRKRWKIDRI